MDIIIDLKNEKRSKVNVEMSMVKKVKKSSHFC